jgi:hypothetical protein
MVSVLPVCVRCASFHPIFASFLLSKNVYYITSLPNNTHTPTPTHTHTHTHIQTHTHIHTHTHTHTHTYTPTHTRHTHIQTHTHLHTYTHTSHTHTYTHTSHTTRNVENVKEELDYPNEWYYDAETEDLFYFHNATGV